jgi:hypothetical protein
MKVQPYSPLVGILVKVVDAVCIERGRTALNAVYLVTLVQQ